MVKVCRITLHYIARHWNETCSRLKKNCRAKQIILSSLAALYCAFLSVPRASYLLVFDSYMFYLQWMKVMQLFTVNIYQFYEFCYLSCSSQCDSCSLLDDCRICRNMTRATVKVTSQTSVIGSSLVSKTTITPTTTPTPSSSPPTPTLVIY